MAVAKCRVCKATVTVRLAEGAIVATGGESFRSRCKERSEEEGSVGEPAACPAMREAVARAALRAEREARPRNVAPPPALAPA